MFSIKSNRLAAHAPNTTKRPTVSDHLSNLELKEDLLSPSPNFLGPMCIGI
jgi:hypothetical protein